MLFAAKYSPEQWAEARRLRAEGQSFKDIAQQLGFRTPHTVSVRARKERWPTTSGAALVTARQTRVRGRSPATASIRRTLALRLYSFLELEIRMKELRMKKQLDTYEQSPAGTEPPMMTKEERESFSTLIEQINQVTEMASEPASAADGRRKSVNPELTALSDEIDADGLAVASQKDDLRAELAQQLAKLVGPA